ncbi:fatty-acid amide hydrolase 2-like isoform X2 [Zerene cesonia]|nr:fatty-acid amide hydrolase 2-like isoform X2 [Zerene cesonia]XP_038222444.1 fatty-acid amide hydrolase 2-like isoform X2 [Zerene cesonia]XP_038222445.1 fatty-acid amide hydrolase 2-like isoform X2 [Zerene cesonia]
MLKQMFFLFRYYLEMFIDFLFSLYWDGHRRSIPPLDKKHSLLKESAVTLAAKIRNKELKSKDLVAVCIERIKLVNPYLNAVTDERFEDALKDAEEVDKMIEKGLSEEEFQQKPFLGVPFTAKESHAVSGMLHTLGIAARRGVRVDYDAECVRLLRAAGAIPVAVTNVPEINKWQETRNMVFGQTNNPYHCGRTVGGSSGGEAALAAALASPISLCSDIGGSTRMPAFYCGLFGLNPTAGHTSLKGSVLRNGTDPTMASIGFASKHLQDLVPLTKIVAGDKAHLLELDRPVDVKKIKYYYVESSKDIRISPICSDLRKAMKRVVSRLSDETTGDSSPRRYYHAGFNYMFALWKHAMTKETESFSRMLTNNTGEVNGICELGKKLIGQSPYTLAAILKLIDDQVLPAVDREWAEKLTEELKTDLLNTLGTDGVLLFPSAPSPAPYHYSLYLRPFNFAYWGIFNVLHMPSIQVPLGLSADGVPLGVQVATAPRRDALCVAAAARLADMFGGYVPPCTLH